MANSSSFFLVPHSCAPSSSPSSSSSLSSSSSSPPSLNLCHPYHLAGHRLPKLPCAKAHLSERIHIDNKVYGLWLLDRQSLLSSAAPRLQAASVHAFDIASRRAEARRMRTPRLESFAPHNPHDPGVANLDPHLCLTLLYMSLYELGVRVGASHRGRP